MGKEEVSSLEDIKEIGEIKYCFPGILIEEKEGSDAVHIPKVLDILTRKIDEMVRRINQLSKIDEVVKRINELSSRE